MANDLGWSYTQVSLAADRPHPSACSTGAFALMAIGMSCCTMTVLMTAVANWFRRKIGLTSGIAVSGFGLGGLLVPIMVKLIEMYE